MACKRTEGLRLVRQRGAEGCVRCGLKTDKGLRLVRQRGAEGWRKEERIIDRSAPTLVIIACLWGAEGGRGRREESVL